MPSTPRSRMPAARRASSRLPASASTLSAWASRFSTGMISQPRARQAVSPALRRASRASSSALAFSGTLATSSQAQTVQRERAATFSTRARGTMTPSTPDSRARVTSALLNGSQR